MALLSGVYPEPIAPGTVTLELVVPERVETVAPATFPDTLALEMLLPPLESALEETVT